jgi:cytochrome c biogenesis factor
MVFAASGPSSPLTAVMIPSLTSGVLNRSRDDAKYAKHRLQQEQRLKFFFATIVFLVVLSIVMVKYFSGETSSQLHHSPHGEMLKKLRRIAPQQQHDYKKKENISDLKGKRKDKRKFHDQMKVARIQKTHESGIDP